MGWMPQITLQEMVMEMMASDLQDAKRHALLSVHGYNVRLPNGT
jgi:GDPmannose 4,6-dehydratase